ncbi:hypothetical protein V500_00756 [Pseudogymnoascus sp. VKM F-4518 (FW-2643)]|nr:hypothetical protein V500_00756 [Pseudogymnoascus sp. VKM F-4518 (FW-2643)]
MRQPGLVIHFALRVVYCNNHVTTSLPFGASQTEKIIIEQNGIEAFSGRVSENINSLNLRKRTCNINLTSPIAPTSYPTELTVTAPSRLPHQEQPYNHRPHTTFYPVSYTPSYLDITHFPSMQLQQGMDWSAVNKGAHAHAQERDGEATTAAVRGKATAAATAVRQQGPSQMVVEAELPAPTPPARAPFSNMAISRLTSAATLASAPSPATFADDEDDDKVEVDRVGRPAEEADKVEAAEDDEWLQNHAPTCLVVTNNPLQHPTTRRFQHGR